MTAKERTDKVFNWIHEITENLPTATKTGLTFGWRTIILGISLLIYFSIKHFNAVSESNHELLVSIAKNDSIRDVKLQKLIAQNEATEKFHEQDLKEHYSMRADIEANSEDIAELFGLNNMRYPRRRGI